MIHLDTHVLVRLYLGQAGELGPSARRAIEEQELMVSPAAILELEFLHEIGRLRPAASKVISVLGRDLGLRVSDLRFWTIVEHALREAWGRDPFDRLIVADAKANGAALITKDEKIHRHYSRAVW
jgi:PIN domain nuclease of toxin-antitoxin system